MLLYRLPKTSHTSFTSSLQVILEELSQEHKQIFLMGDFNIDTCKPYRCCSSTQNFTNLLLDNIYSNYCLDNCNCGILCTDFSDHFPLFCIIDNITLACKQKTVVKRIFNNKNINKFSHLLMDHNWNYIFNITDAQSAFTELQGVIDHLLENCFPEQTVMRNYKTGTHG